MTRLNDEARWLVSEIAEAKRMASALGKPQLGNSAIEAGKIEEYDQGGTLVQIVGEQHDGTHAPVTVNGPVPPEPAAPAVTAGIGSVEARWSGKFAGDALSPMDFSHVALHASRLEAFAPSNETQLATITGELGDVAVVLIDAGEWTFGLVAVSKAGKWSQMSETVTIDIPDYPSPVDIQDELIILDEKYDGVLTESGNLGNRLSQAEIELVQHEQRLGQAQSRIDDAFVQIGSAEDLANTAQTNANQAKADAAAAAGIAEGKGDVIIQATAPVTQMRKSTTLWIDTTGGANTPKRWSGSAWVAVTDKTAVDAAAAAVAAANKAQQAIEAAAEAKARAEAAIRQAPTLFEWTADYSVGDTSTQTKTSTEIRYNGNQDASVYAHRAVSKSVPIVANRVYRMQAIVSNLGSAAARLQTGFYLNNDAGGYVSSLWPSDSYSPVPAGASRLAVFSTPRVGDLPVGTSQAAAAIYFVDRQPMVVHDLKVVDVTDIITAQETADNALTMAGSKSKVFYSTSNPTGTASQGDVWRKVDSSKNVIAEWFWGAAGKWESSLVTTQMISNLDVGKLTVGSGVIADLVAQTIAASTAAFQTVDVKNLYVTTGTLTEAVINKLWADVVMSRKITATMLAIGDFENLAPSLADQPSDWELSGGMEISTSNLDDSGQRFRVNANTASAFAYAPAREAKAGDQFFASAKIYRSADSTGIAYLRMYWYDKAGTAISNTNFGYSAAGNGASIQGNVSAPVGTAKARLAVAKAAGAGDTGFYSVYGRRMFGGEAVIDGSLKSAKIDTQDLAANTGFIADLTARIVKADMFVGKEFSGGTFTGSVFQTSGVANIGLKLDSAGLRVYPPEGGEPVTEIRADGGTVYSITDPVTGEVLAALDAEGGITGQSLTVASSSRMDGPVVMGADPLTAVHGSGDLGPTILGRDLLDSSLMDFMETQETITDDTPWLSALPRGMVTRGFRDLSSWQATGKEGELLEVSYQNYPNRGYKILVSPFSAYLEAGVTAHLRIYRSVGTRPTMNSPVFHRQSLRNETTSSLLLDFGGTFYDLSTSGRVRYLITLESIGGKVQVFGSADGGSLRVWVEDIGLAALDTSIARAGVRDNGSTSAPPAPTAPVEKTDPPKQYTATIAADWWQAYTGDGTQATHSTYSGTAAQGRSPYAPSNGVMRGLVGFPSQASRLSGATVKKIEVYVYAKHWHSSAGGTLCIGVHENGSKPSNWSSATNNVKQQKMKKPEGRWITLPSSVHARFKSGDTRGISFLPPSSSTSSIYYGLITGSRTKLRITYTK
ncbi:hypothetical protein [Glutamicibacter sp. TV12E]|uniref:hypothetical protein n=1 Tax=Glutamicibacter sp. TV12E TaxID=3446362 RepID=UPI0040348553